MGMKRSEEARLKMRNAHLGKKQSPELIKKRIESRKNNGYRHSQATREKMSASQKKGPDHPFWRGGVTPANKVIRRSLEFKLWREAVFKRDNWTCVWCGVRGGVLHPDHIKPFAYYPELRFAIDNGRTLCKPCHMTTDTWGHHGQTFRKYDK